MTLERRTPLPRGEGLKRKSPLKSGTSPARGTGLARAPRKPAAARDTGPSPKVRALVLERDGYACVCCGQSVIGQEYSLQHRQRRSQGGGNTPPNLVTVLGSGSRGHHWRIDSRRDPADEAKGYTVRSWDDPALVPVTVMSADMTGAVVWLTDDGRYSAVPPEGAEAA